MKKKIGNLVFDTINVSKCNIKNLVSTIYPLQTLVDVCPICGGRLFNNYSYAAQISKTECVKFTGDACLHCNAFFSQQSKLLEWLRIKKFNKGTPELNDAYNMSIEKSTSKIFNEFDSVFRMYLLMAENKVRIFFITCQKEAACEEKGILHYSHSIAYTLLKNEMSGIRKVFIDGTDYIITVIKKKELVDTDLKDDIELTINNQIAFNDKLPDFSTDTVLYIYKGNIACHKRHHLAEVKVIIPLSDNPLGFYAEYCFECNKYIMKYSDYETYLKRFKLFPSKVRFHSQYDNDDFFNRAEKSPLMLNGYSVSIDNGLSQIQREQILSFIMDYGILPKRKVLDYLDMFISTNKNNSNKDRAVSKWKTDKEYVLQYSERETPRVVIGKVVRYR